jgi:Leucine Rich repeat
MSIQPLPPARPWRRHLRFSLRALLLVILLLGLWLGWFVHTAKIQHDAVAAIQKNGGWVRYYWRDYASAPYGEHTYYPRGARPWRPSFFLPRDWLSDRFGIDYFDEVIGVSFNATASFSDADLTHVAAFPALNDLSLVEVPVTDSMLAHLEASTNLTVLSLWGARITDSGLSHFKGLRKFRKLFLVGSRITDEGLERLKALKNLTTLDLSGTWVSDTGLVHLKGFSDLLELNLRATWVGDAGLVHLKSLSKLQYLDLGSTQVTDAGLVHLNGMAHLENLIVTRTRLLPPAFKPSSPRSRSCKSTPSDDQPASSGALTPLVPSPRRILPRSASERSPPHAPRHTHHAHHPSCPRSAWASPSPTLRVTHTMAATTDSRQLFLSHPS